MTVFYIVLLASWPFVRVCRQAYSSIETCYYSATIERVCLCVCVCVFVCLSAIISLELHVRFSPNFVHVTFGPGSVLLRRRSDTLCTSGFIDDVMVAHKPRLLDVAAQLKRSAHAVLDINCAQ